MRAHEAITRTPERLAFLDAIAVGEGTATTPTTRGYHILVGGTYIESLEKHPGLVVHLSPQLWSSAFGRYQFLRTTWRRLALRYGYPDMSPANQDDAALQLLRERGALPHIDRGEIREAVALAAPVWASLPGSPYGQRTVAYDTFARHYHRALKRRRAST